MKTVLVVSSLRCCWGYLPKLGTSQPQLYSFLFRCLGSSVSSHAKLNLSCHQHSSTARASTRELPDLLSFIEAAMMGLAFVAARRVCLYRRNP